MNCVTERASLTEYKRTSRDFHDFASSNTILSCDVETARQCGTLKDQLRKKGRPIPENDLWIAAITIQHNLTLATRDVHFGLIEEFKVETW